jgi:hypothetical protein
VEWLKYLRGADGFWFGRRQTEPLGDIDRFGRGHIK